MSQNQTSQTLPQWIADHIQLYLEDPAAAHYWDSTVAGGPGPLPTLLLISKGRKSGQTRMLPLIYKKIGARYVIIASKGGAPSHPAWYLNLLAEPHCEIRVGPESHQVIAHTVDDERREKLWNAMAEVYPPYNDYQAATDRKIPVVELLPVS